MYVYIYIYIYIYMAASDSIARPRDPQIPLSALSIAYWRLRCPSFSILQHA